jgi:hypothetical protein
MSFNAPITNPLEVVDFPQFQLPFKFTPDGSTQEIEYNSVTEIQQAVWAILSYIKGQLMVDANFGVDDPTFAINGLDIDILLDQVTEYEPRANEFVVSNPDWWQTAVQTIFLSQETIT